MTEIIDRSVLAGLGETVGEDFVAELIDTFLEEGPGMIAEMEQALSARDADKFRRAAHSLKSNANTFGAMDLAEKARELESMARENNLDIGERLQVLEETYENAANELKSLR